MNAHAEVQVCVGRHRRGCLLVARVHIAGVPTMDTQTAQHFGEAARAGQQPAAQIVLTGVRSAIAQASVHLGTDLF